MTRFKFFGFLLPLAIAGGLALGLAAAPAMADKPDPVTHMHDHSGENDDEPGTRIEVELVCAGAGPCQDLLPVCQGTTTQMRLDTLSADFAQGCTIKMTLESPPGTDLDLSLFAASVKNAGKNAMVTELRLYFTTNEDFRIGDIPDVYVTDSIVVTIAGGPAGSETVTLEPLAPGCCGTLTKLHQPGKGQRTQETVSFVSITYEPVDAGP